MEISNVIKAKLRDDISENNGCRQMLYGDFKKSVRGSFRYMDKTYDHILASANTFKRCLDTLECDKEIIEDFKIRFEDVINEIGKLVWTVHEYRDCINGIIEDGLNFEYQFAKTYLRETEPAPGAIDYLITLCANKPKRISAEIKKHARFIKDQYARTDTEILTFWNEFDKLKIENKDPMRLSKKVWVGEVYKRLMRLFYDDYKKEYEKYHRQELKEFVKKITELSG